MICASFTSRLDLINKKHLKWSTTKLDGRIAEWILKLQSENMWQIYTNFLSVTSLIERTRKRSQRSEWNYSKKPEEHAIEQQRISVKLLTKSKNSNIFLNRWLNSFQTSATPFIHSIQLNVLQSACKRISKPLIRWQIISKIEEK